MASHEACCGTMFWVYLMSCVGLVMFAGLMSGLTLGLMSLSLVDLEVLAKAGTPKDKLNAARILPVVKNQHLLLCTLLIGNSLAMEALPIFLDTLVPPYVAVLISVTLILAFGEIMPQAICTRYGLSVGAKAAPVVRLLLILFFPVAYPISKLLDWLLGKGHFALMRRAELKTLVDMHGNEAGKGGELTHDETTIITGALELTQKIAKDAMTAISETFSLDINAKLDLYEPFNLEGHSRVPIYSGMPSNIIGLILVKNLITCRAEDEVPIRNLTIRKIPRVADDLPLYDILNEFQKGHSHMAVVIKRTKEAGVSTEKQKSTTADYKINPKDARADVLFHFPFAGHTYFQEIILVFLWLSGSSPSYGSTAVSRRINIEKHGDGRPYNKKSERKRENILDFNNDPLPSYSMDEEAVGIITMEDVMEELLQEEIYDETDEYVDVHNKIRINMLTPGKSLSPAISPGGGPLSQGFRRTPMASPFSPYHHGSSVLRSPASNHGQSPGTLPTILSPGRSPTAQTPGQSSPNGSQVSINSNGQHKKDGES
ncbi:Hemolysin [Zea mays]|uniref:Hemolysin n=1 Tax=Zea mays TaxID=4577 RepID=A0A1D6PKU2_MAIZE|nr:Hemolysin [Zea mays]